MANVDELCQFARLGQTFKIQKYLQTHSVDINALNLYGESALSMATYYNQISTIEYLLANKADPKLRLSAGHTTIHIACRLANVSILHLLLSIKNNEEEQQQQKDKHIYDCLRIKDHANLTPIHWAATQESVSKRQKVFAYLDQRMPGVLDSRYDINWFNSWAKTHPWVIEEKLTKNILPISTKQILPKLINTDKVNRQNSEQGPSLPLFNGYTPVDMIPRTSLHDYEPTPRTPPTAAATIVYDNDIDEQKKRISSKIEHAPQAPKLPLTPITSRIVAFTHHYISKHEHHTNEYHKPSSKQSSSNNNMTPNSQKIRYFQRFSSIIKNSLSPLSDRSTYHAEKAHVIPTLNFPCSSTSIENKRYDYEDITSPISSKRPCHNLLSNILPSTTSLSSSNQSSRQLIKPFNFDTSCNLQHHHNRTTIETYKQNNESDNEDNDYLCKSTSTLDISSSDAYIYDV